MRTVRLAYRRDLQVLMAFCGNAIPIAIACAAGWSSHRTLFFVGAAGASVVPLLVTGLPASMMIVRRVVALSGLIALTLMQAYTGGAASGDALLMMMPMMWFGMQTGTREVLAMITFLCVCAYLPMILVGPPAYPVEWAHATLLVVVGAMVAGSLRVLTRETNRVTDQLRQAASTDPLTGLLNRRGWDATTDVVLAQARRRFQPLVAAVVDLDGFKQLNDHLGHDAGDAILCETAQRLRSTFRAGDVVARSGGDEFIALLVDTTGEAALAAVERLRDPSPKRQSLSVGIAVWDPSESVPDLLRRADLALYEAKRAGGGRPALAPTALRPLGEEVERPLAQELVQPLPGD